ncbi:MAG: hypothetical protein KGI33_09760 [Thaumarchaeota archaeon]|nr:hypothetical protein [Nitrososphaerota archaeon]
MFKNLDEQERALASHLGGIRSERAATSVLYSDPFLKAGLFSLLVDRTQDPVLYLDLDLMFSGYVVSGAVPRKENLVLYQPTRETLVGMVAEVCVRASSARSLVIIDSINGLYNILHDTRQAGKTIASILMMIAGMSRFSGSSVVMASMARYRKEEGWVLSPTGKRIIEARHGRKVLLEYGRGGIAVNPLDGQGRFLIPADSVRL